MQHLDSRVWDQNLPRILRKQTRAILVCPLDRSNSASDHLLAFHLLLCPVSFYLKRNRLRLSFRRRKFQNFVRSPYCVLNTHAATSEVNVKINHRNGYKYPQSQLPTILDDAASTCCIRVGRAFRREGGGKN